MLLWKIVSEVYQACTLLKGIFPGLLSITMFEGPKYTSVLLHNGSINHCVLRSGGIISCPENKWNNPENLTGSCRRDGEDSWESDTPHSFTSCGCDWWGNEEATDHSSAVMSRTRRVTSFRGRRPFRSVTAWTGGAVELRTSEYCSADRNSVTLRHR